MTIPGDVVRAQSEVRSLETLLGKGHAGGLDSASFPRDIAAILIHGLEIPVLRLKQLTLSSAESYLCALCDAGTPDLDQTADRALFGLLHVGPPFNAIFLQDSLPECVERYVLAHELGHFLMDILRIRRVWERSLPDRLQAIQSAFTWEDMDPLLDLEAAVKGLPRRPNAIHGRGSSLRASATRREIHADLFARELLAPWDVACQRLVEDRREFAERIRSEFCLPLRIAAAYHDELKRRLVPSPDVFARLFSLSAPPAQET